MSERRDGDQRRHEIRSAALRLVGTRGLHKLTTSALAQEVGLTDGAIFRHFKDKQAIILAAIEHFEELLMEGFPPEEEHPLKRLRLFFFQRLALIRRHPEIRAIAFSDQLGRLAGEEGAERVRQVIHKTLDFVRDCLKEAQEQRMISEDIPIEVLMWSVVGVIRGSTSTVPVEIVQDPGIFSPPQKQEDSLSGFEKIWNGLEQLLRRSK